MFKTSSQARVLNDLVRTKATFEVPSALYSTCVILPHIKVLFLGKKNKNKKPLGTGSFMWFRLTQALRVCLNPKGDTALHVPNRPLSSCQAPKEIPEDSDFKTT